jgi:predicted amidophosphoribosyltransferase
LTDGTVVEVLCAYTYIPLKRGARHCADVFSQALSLAKMRRDLGEQFAHDVAGDLAALVPENTELIATPPAGRHSSARGWYFTRELSIAVAQVAQVGLCRPLRWAVTGADSMGKAIGSQAGHGRKLGRLAECVEDLAGRRVCIIDDVCTTGITITQAVEALRTVGAEVVGTVALARTERTEDRPENERARLKQRRGRPKRGRPASTTGPDDIGPVESSRKGTPDGRD